MPRWLLAPYGPASAPAMGGRGGGALGRGLLRLAFPFPEPLSSACEPKPAGSRSALRGAQPVSSPFLRRQPGRRKRPPVAVFPGDRSRRGLPGRRRIWPSVPHRVAAGQAQQRRPHGETATWMCQGVVDGLMTCRAVRRRPGLPPPAFPILKILYPPPRVSPLPDRSSSPQY